MPWNQKFLKLLDGFKVGLPQIKNYATGDEIFFERSRRSVQWSELLRRDGRVAT